MNEHAWLAERFEETRDHLRAVAYRMLGSAAEADDAVQEAWIRLSRADTGDVENLGGWLTTVVARVCLDMLRSRKSKREESLDEAGADPIASPEALTNPEREVLLADSVGLALLLVLDTLPPAERVAFVLHDLFDLPFEEVAPIVGRTPAAARQLASRARRRVRSASAVSDADRTRQREVVDAFLSASRNGDFGALLALLDPDVVLRADQGAVRASEARRARGAPELAPEMRGAAIVAKTLSGTAQAAQLALLDGVAGAVWAPGGQPRAAFAFTLRHGKIAGIEILTDPDRVRRLDVVLIDDQPSKS
jgi:RNA polymerase sigma factor (sigma-70 family)